MASCQATVFTPEHNFSSAKLLKEFYTAVPLFDGEPAVIPSMPGMPAEIPRMILASGSGEWRCEVAPARLNLFWRRTQEETDPIPLSQFFERAIEILGQYEDATHSRIGRLASVLTRFIPNEEPGKLIADRFCKTEWTQGEFKDVQSFELHVHRRFTIYDGLQVNSWVRSKSGNLTTSTEGKTTSVLLVEQDINTLSEEMEQASFSREDWTTFFGSVEPEFSKMLSALYPDSK